MINHMYWCVVSTPCGDSDTIVTKWLSLKNHIHNKHSGHGELFAKCTNKRLVRQDRKKWFKWRKYSNYTGVHILFNLLQCFLDSKSSEKILSLITIE